MDRMHKAGEEDWTVFVPPAEAEGEVNGEDNGENNGEVNGGGGEGGHGSWRHAHIR
jgi:hypothetical protein